MNLAIVKYLLSTKGRTNRTEFLAYAFIYTLVFYLLIIPFIYAPYNVHMIVFNISVFVYFVFSGALLIRRVHDYDEGAWYALLILIPIINLYVMFAPGSPMPNRFGEQPQPASMPIRVLAISYIALPFVFLALIAIFPQFRQYIQAWLN